MSLPAAVVWYKIMSPQRGCIIPRRRILELLTPLHVNLGLLFYLAKLWIVSHRVCSKPEYKHRGGFRHNVVSGSG